MTSSATLLLIVSALTFFQRPLPSKAGRDYVATVGDNAGSDECNVTIHSKKMKKGTIMSPGYPEKYRAGVKCNYHLFGLPTERIVLTIRVDLLEHNPDDTDLLIVVTSVAKNAPAHGFSDHTSTNRNKSSEHTRNQTLPEQNWEEILLLNRGKYSILGVFSGKKDPPVLMSAGNHVIITMVTKTPTSVKDESPWIVPPTGFHVNYSFVEDFGIEVGKQKKSGECTFTFSASQQESGLVYSPNHLSRLGTYPRSTDCFYLFLRRPWETLEVKFKFLDVDGIPPECSVETNSDFLELFSRSSNKRFRLCTSHPEEEILGSRWTYRFGPEAEFGSNGKAATDNSVVATKEGDEEISLEFHSNNIFDARGFLAEYRYEIYSAGSEPISNARNRILLPAFVIYAVVFR